jgi:aminopeptidase N
VSVAPVMRGRTLLAGLAALAAVGCERSVAAPTDAATEVKRDAAAEVGSDGGAPLASFRGVAVRTWDRELPEVDAIGYEIDVAVDESTPRAEVFRGELRGLFVATRALDALTLDYAGEAVDGAEVDGREARATREGEALRVPLGRTVRAGEAFRVTVRYRGSLFQGTGASASDLERFGGLMVFQRNRAGRKIYESLNWPAKARRWLPVRDHPRDGAMVAVTATFPSRYTVLANGRLEGVRDAPGEARAWSYFCATPMPVYDVHLAAYDDWAETTARSPRNDRALRWLPYAGDAAAAATLFGDLGAAMDYYEGEFGPFRWEQAGFVEAPIFGGGMEHATLVTMDESLFRAPAASRAITFHELAHHWSGNLVRIATWNDFWLSEGLTDYLTGRFIEAHDGPAAGLRTWRNYLGAALAAERGGGRHPLRPADPEIDPLRIFDAITYKKGALVLRTLEHQVGTEAFTAFLRGWFDRHAGAAMDSRALAAELAAAFPEADIAGFFAGFVYGEFVPVLAATTRYDDAARRVTLTLRQTQTLGPEGGFRLPVTVSLARGAQQSRATVALDGISTETSLPLDFEPDGVTVDPDERSYVTTACSDAAPCRAGWACAAATATLPAMCVPNPS